MERGMDLLLGLLPRPPRDWKRAVALAVLFFALREASFMTFREKNIKGDVAVITGGAGGIGRLMTLKLARDGCNVVVWDLDLAAAEKVAQEARALGIKAAAYRVDVTDRQAVYNTGRQVEKDFGKVDIVVNNAGIVAGKKLLEADDARAELTIKINTIALMWVTKAFLKGMIERKHGHIVTIASSAGRVGVSGMVDYCASKFGAVGFDEALRMELRLSAPEIRTTCVCPGYIGTGMFLGAKMRSSLEFLNPIVERAFPVLEPDYAAEKIVTAIKRNQAVLVMPRLAYMTFLMRALLPVPAFDAAMEYLGVSRSMEKFEQTRA